MTATISTISISFGESGHWARFSHWILVDWSEGLYLSIKKLAFQFRECLWLQGRETCPSYRRQKKESYVSIERAQWPLMEPKNGKSDQT